ncbi:OVARIAN TUMOR DOMAIN-containing deubiquitinating enzyme 12-like isoform X2 [Actinidia eriantha]|uniref:OVARIAN TUMOR DOMAIN-containing deubiquitinating enzyme 12-like isoform X2 n=1 Tax=Actinidia eriantha TaxID=165200 RepID=UPI0025896326|nr:OVARIAN TUMOR DOMAIN-containing deubiquitinating enzyme 12-like isoform X2 [Actinidia eriantha]
MRGTARYFTGSIRASFEEFICLVLWENQVFISSESIWGCNWKNCTDLQSYTGHNDYYTQHSNVENDEIIAHALQEELSQIANTEASESSHAEEPLQASSFSAPDWLSSSNYYSGDDMGPANSSSSPVHKSYDGEEYYYNLEITDESALDGEVCKRVNQMIPVPHVPRINGDIPSTDEATSDHQRLLDRLKLYDLVEQRVQGDGNCQFRALSDQFYRTPEHHQFVRQEVVNQLKSHRDLYEGYVPMEYGEYLKKMSESGEWGDHVTLQAAADSYGVKIFVVTSFKDTCSIEILPKFQKSIRVICLSFWAEVHYNSIYPQGDLPPSDFRRKKSWWPFGSKD